MNLPLHFGLLGSLEAGLIAFLAGLIVYALVAVPARRLAWPAGPVIGWSCVVAVVVSAGLDAWNLFYLSTIRVRLESPLYARLALQSVHDPDQLGARVVLEIVGALAGVALAYWWFSARTGSHGRDGQR
ncbi:hypothetical protein [Xanthomonas massiliensis]|jgi:hypothetical protein|uniref:hypothetical protein n=1 Tax=Xanthomonas massiliensis TaxID=1720302 RepID=UPI000824C607|nr:hypothetical protein [Xanthomonas massiliensis]